MTDKLHALLSCSGSERWLECTASPRLEEKFPQTSSIFAEEGTLAHDLAELTLQKRMKEITLHEYKVRLKIIENNPLYTSDMPEHVKKYIDYVLRVYRKHEKADFFTELLIEQKVDLSKFIPEGKGTCDSIVKSDNVIEIVDLKYGKGIKVDAQDNSQLKLYALGALESIPLEYVPDISEVRMTIIQPRLDNVSKFKMPMLDLYDWALGIVEPKAKEAFHGPGTFSPGDACQWCRAKAVCPALAEHNHAILTGDFSKMEIDGIDIGDGVDGTEVQHWLGLSPLIEEQPVTTQQYAIAEVNTLSDERILSIYEKIFGLG